jgi:hypothetical protein
MDTIFDRLGTTPEELHAGVVKAKQASKERDGRICICGHPAKCHTSEAGEASAVHFAMKASGRNKCFPGRQSCPCRKFVGVLIASDVRKFMHRTTGPGPGHALTKGIDSGAQSHISMSWTENAVCELCKRSDVVLTAVSLDNTLFESNDATPINYLLCAEDRMNVYNKAVANLQQRNGEANGRG